MEKVDEMLKMIEELEVKVEGKTTQEIHELIQWLIKETENAKMDTNRIIEFYYNVERYLVCGAKKEKAIN